MKSLTSLKKVAKNLRWVQDMNLPVDSNPSHHTAASKFIHSHL